MARTQNRTYEAAIAAAKSTSNAPLVLDAPGHGGDMDADAAIPAQHSINTIETQGAAAPPAMHVDTLAEHAAKLAEHTAAFNDVIVNKTETASGPATPIMPADPITDHIKVGDDVMFIDNLSPANRVNVDMHLPMRVIRIDKIRNTANLGGWDGWGHPVCRINVSYDQSKSTPSSFYLSDEKLAIKNMLADMPGYFPGVKGARAVTSSDGVTL